MVFGLLWVVVNLVWVVVSDFFFGRGGWGWIYLSGGRS